MSAQKKLNALAYGTTDEEKNSAMYQSQHCCPKERDLYAKCTDDFNAIDITTRLTTPIRHQINCQNQFIGLRVCVSKHLQSWIDVKKEVLAEQAAEQK